MAFNDSASVITSIYDAAINDKYWEEALDRCVEFIGARTGALLVFDGNAKLLNNVSRASAVLRKIDKDVIEFYSSNLVKYEQKGWEHLLSLPKQTLISDKEIWPANDKALIQREDYSFLLEHAGVLRRLAARLNDYESWTDNIAFQFDKSMSVIPPNSKERMQLLLPHAAKTIELGRTFGLLQSQYKAVLTALDHVDIGICIALKDGTIVVKNEQAERVFGSDDGMEIARNGLIKITGSLEMENALRMAISETSSTAHGDNLRSECLLSIHRPSGCHPYLIEISPLRDAAGELEPSLSGSLVKIIDPENSNVIRTDRLTKAYKFTEAEAAIAKLVIRGWTNPNIADQRNVSIDTVKTQMTSIRQKTRTKSRSELIMLALKTSPPVH